MAPTRKSIDSSKFIDIDENVVKNYPVVSSSISKIQAQDAEDHKNIYEDQDIVAAKRVIHFLYELWKKESFVDVKFQTADVEVFAHRVILGAHSPVLLEMLQKQSCNHMVSLDLYDVSSTDCKDVLKFLYTSDINLTDENINGVLRSSIRMNIETLRKICSDYLSQYSVENALSYHAVCINNNLLLLAAKIWQYICENFEELSNQDEFMQQSLDDIIIILSEDRLNVSSEMVVVNSAIMWLRKNSHKILNVNEIWDCIRFPLIQPEQLLQLENYQYMSNNPEIQSKIYNAIW